MKNDTIIEYACYDESIKDNIQKNVFRAINLGITNISIPMNYIGIIADYIFTGLNISCPIDWPNGRSDTELRIHEIYKASNKGATTVDIVTNHYLFLNKHKLDFIRDIKSLIKISEEKSLNIRFMVDHRKIKDSKQFKNLLNILKKSGVNTIICSTGQYVEELLDNVIMCKIAEKMGFNTICNGNLYLPRHLELVKKHQLFGARFNNINTLENSITGV